MTDNTNDGPRYPDCRVKLIGRDGNSFYIIGSVRSALRQYLAGVGYTPAEIHAILLDFSGEATRGDYHNLLITAMNWVTVE